MYSFLSRLKGNGGVTLQLLKAETRLDILVEAMGRMYFGKGISPFLNSAISINKAGWVADIFLFP